MRSDLIFGALTHVKNRYELCQLASKATRKLHKPNTRVQDTTNDVLGRFRVESPVGAELASPVRSNRVQNRRAA
ncbi:DNA-directed RNA polymerase subunit omega [Terriglobus tenax]|uniref:DNA-directed RNA polymerase subunit omega n=1 Tax=Terriglobus tenax TaxID=1111115 RepID=UPI0021DFF1AB|nr:DNA-directed RNA polymerase subunit omega [Terriglobus tenax]